MRKTSTLTLLFSVMLGLGLQAQTPINYQGFEATSNDNWNFTVNPATYNTEGDSIVAGSDDVWAVIEEFTGDIDTSSQGLYFWGCQDLDNGNGGGSFYHTIDLDIVNLSAYAGQNVTVSFDYYSVGLDGTDSIEYQIAYDSSNVWAANGIVLNKNTLAWTNVSINVPANSPYVRLRLQMKQNGGSDYGGFDNISLSASASLPAPVVSGFEIINNTQLAVAYSQGVATPSATTTANYSTTPALSYSGVTLSTSLDTAWLNLSSPLVDGTAYQMIIDNIVDTAGTMMAGPDTINFIWNQSTPNLVITEIMYNDPSGPDTLEYLEILNNGTAAADLGGLTLDGITYEFPMQSLAAGAYLIVTTNLANHNSVFSGSATNEWTSGGLSNGGEDVAIYNSLGDTIDYVDYDDGTPWSSQADGSGYSLILCDPTTDNNDAANWGISNNVSATIGTTTLYGSPGSVNTCPPPMAIPTYPISTINTEDAQGVADSLNVYCKIHGTVVGIDYDGNAGLSFFIYDNTGGMNIFNFSDVGTFQVAEGDSIRVIGSIAQFNGLTELVPDSIVVLATGITLKAPTVVTTLDESTESEFIKLENVSLVDTTGWPTANFGNFDLLVGADTFTLRIDSDTDISANWPTAPSGTFSVVGLGSQFDNIGGNQTPPYDSEYQILPRFFTDIDTNVVVVPPAPSLFINEVMADNQGFVSDDHNDANDDWVEIFNPNAMDVDLAGMYLTDDNTNATKYMFPTGDPATVVPANGHLMVWCDNGQTQAGPLHANFDLDAAGELVKLYHVDGTSLIDSVSFGALNTNESYGRVADGDAAFTTFVGGSSQQPTPGSENGVVGIDLLNSSASAFVAYPNPVDGSEVFFNQLVNVAVFNVVGQEITRARQVNQLSVEGWDAGIYLILTETGDSVRLIVK